MPKVRKKSGKARRSNQTVKGASKSGAGRVAKAGKSLKAGLKAGLRKGLKKVSKKKAPSLRQPAIKKAPKAKKARSAKRAA